MVKSIGTALAGILLVTSDAIAVQTSATDFVFDISSGDASYSPAPPAAGATSGDYITLKDFKGPGTAGTCQKRSGDSRVKLFVRDDERGKRMIAIATAAMLAGKKVAVMVDEAAKIGGSNNCLLQFITINSEP